ncbi:MAG: hypothetical protein K2X47_09950 [Bdellovibrionales bacterium]|nr:hypothetical protein [Bdellovibrionales bacterium]
MEFRNYGFCSTMFRPLGMLALLGSLVLSPSLAKTDDMMGTMPQQPPSDSPPMQKPSSDSTDSDHDHGKMMEDHKKMMSDHKNMQKMESKKAMGDKKMNSKMEMKKKKKMPMPMMDDDQMKPPPMKDGGTMKPMEPMEPMEGGHM